MILEKKKYPSFFISSLKITYKNERNKCNFKTKLSWKHIQDILLFLYL